MSQMAARPLPTVEEASDLLASLIPSGHSLRVTAVEPPARLVFAAGPDHLEYALGGAVSGPTIFRLVDYASFLAVNAVLGRAPATVLAQSSFSFLEAAQPGALRITVDLVQAGIRTAVTSVQMSDGRGWLVATATLHFALPTRRGRPATSSAGAGS